jgi:ABC-2 type transport system permease protein
MVREKEQGTIIQVYASSLSAIELLLGKGLAYFVVASGQTLFIMVLGSLLFGLRLAGDATPLLIGTLVFLITSVLFGLFIGVRASTQIVAFQGVTTIGFLTASFLTGFIYPLSNIPFPLSLVSNFVPARYYIELTRDAFIRGGGWASVWSDVLVLVWLGLLLFTAAWRGLRRMQLPN